jgi:ring-1,2-phenylacetyl-CoA epoxidase subunit PaaE
MNASTPIAPRFHSLSVKDIRRETADAVTLTFDIPPALEDAFRFEPGQYLTLRTTIGGEEIRRSYSICSGPADGEIRIAVKRVDDGVFSSHINGVLALGDSIDVMSPTGRFGLATATGGKTYVGFAAGSGITPILSILKGLLVREPDSRFFLFYGSRTVSDVLFRKELEELKDRNLGRLSVFHVLSREEQDLAILNGHIDGAKVRLLLSTMIPAAMVDHAFICGPAPMIDDLEATLGDLGLSADKIHVERFVSAHGGLARAKPPVAPDAPPAHLVTITVDGKRREVPAAKDESILDAALRAGIDLPFACKGGMCSTCRARIVEGSAQMDVNYSLEKWEIDKGFVLTCQAKPTSKRIIVDFDAV